MLSSQQSRLCSRWRLNGRSDAEKTSTENKCMPRLKLLALSRSDESLTEFSAAKSNLPARILLHLTPCHGRHIPLASPSLISLLMNHFTQRWNVTQRANIGRITNLLISYWAEWGGEKERIKHHLGLSALFRSSRLILLAAAERKRVQGRVGMSPVAEVVYSHCHGCDVCKMSADVSLWFISYSKLTQTQGTHADRWQHADEFLASQWQLSEPLVTFLW